MKTILKIILAGLFLLSVTSCKGRSNFDPEGSLRDLPGTGAGKEKK
jgi:hypothetical protein